MVRSSCRMDACWSLWVVRLGWLDRADKPAVPVTWAARNGAEGPFVTFQERVLADTIQNIPVSFEADVIHTHSGYIIRGRYSRRRLVPKIVHPDGERSPKEHI